MGPVKRIIGLSRDNRLVGRVRDDFNVGNDTFIGGGGIDAVGYSGKFADFTSTNVGDVELLKFGDMTVDLRSHAPIARADRASTDEDHGVARGSVLASDCDVEVLLHRQNIDESSRLAEGVGDVGESGQPHEQAFVDGDRLGR